MQTTTLPPGWTQTRATRFERPGASVARVTRAHTMCWRVTFDNGRQFHALALDEAVQYADDYLLRQPAEQEARVHGCG